MAGWKVLMIEDGPALEAANGVDLGIAKHGSDGLKPLTVEAHGRWGEPSGFRFNKEKVDSIFKLHQAGYLHS